MEAAILAPGRGACRLKLAEIEFFQEWRAERRLPRSKIMPNVLVVVGLS